MHVSDDFEAAGSTDANALPDGNVLEDQLKDNQILDLMMADSSFQLIKGGRPAVAALLPDFREMCRAREWTVENGIREVGALLTASIAVPILAQSNTGINGQHPLEYLDNINP